MLSLSRTSSDTILTDQLLSELRQEFAATAAQHDADGSFPFANFKRLAEARLLALTVPKRFGGLGGGISEAARLVAAVGAGEASTGLVLQMNCMMHYLLGRRQPPGYDAIARAAVAGTGTVNALQAEPDLGSVVRGGLPGTVASRSADGTWRINGRKSYATGSPIVGWWLTLVRTDEDTPRVGTVIVPAASPGISVVPSWNHAGLRATASHELRFDNVVLPAGADQALLPAGSPEQVAGRALVDEWFCLLTAALYDGIARAGRDWLLHFLHSRVPSNLGQPLATVPRLQGVVGEIESLLLINRSLIDDAILRAEGASEPDQLRAQLVKHVVTNNVVRALELALSITGNHGLDRANPLERHYRDALCGRVHAPQSDSILTNAGRAALAA